MNVEENNQQYYNYVYIFEELKDASAETEQGRQGALQCVCIVNNQK